MASKSGAHDFGVANVNSESSSVTAAATSSGVGFLSGIVIKFPRQVKSILNLYMYQPKSRSGWLRGKLE
jgi:hypothetical protein